VPEAVKRNIAPLLRWELSRKNYQPRLIAIGTATDCYQPVERELRLTATHDGHVRLAVFPRQSSVPDRWSAAAVIRLDPGKEMTRVAGDVAALLVPLQS
jgi:hypothetical protein